MGEVVIVGVVPIGGGEGVRVGNGKDGEIVGGDVDVDVDTVSSVVEGLDVGTEVGGTLVGSGTMSLKTPSMTKPPEQSMPETSAAVLVQSISKHPFSKPSIP